VQVAKITLWDGRTFYTNECSWDRIKRFFDNVKAAETPPADARNQVDLIEMTQEEYHAIPATVESALMFGCSHDD
jgi:hypothetical protein